MQLMVTCITNILVTFLYIRYISAISHQFFTYRIQKISNTYIPTAPKYEKKLSNRNMLVLHFTRYPIPMNENLLFLSGEISPIISSYLF